MFVDDFPTVHTDRMDGSRHEPSSDCVVVGAGPAGLTAAIYAARFRRSVIVLDGSAPRAAAIPRPRNYPGFPDGIAGLELVGRLRDQAERFGVRVLNECAFDLRRAPGGFAIDLGQSSIFARTVVMASGIADVRPPIGPQLHDRAVADGLIRYCPICDGYEVFGKRVAVAGNTPHAVREALFVRGFSDDVTLVSWRGLDWLSALDRATLTHAGIALIDEPIIDATLRAGEIVLKVGSRAEPFQALYPALGADVRSRLASGLGAETDESGYLLVDGHQRTSVPGLYAAGDVVAGLNQISRATGQAATAATALHNDLRAEYQHGVAVPAG